MRTRWMVRVFRLDAPLHATCRWISRTVPDGCQAENGSLCGPSCVQWFFDADSQIPFRYCTTHEMTWDQSVWLAPSSQVDEDHKNILPRLSLGFSLSSPHFCFRDYEGPGIQQLEGSCWLRLGSIIDDVAQLSVRSPGNSLCLGHSLYLYVIRVHSSSFVDPRYCRKVRLSHTMTMLQW